MDKPVEQPRYQQIAAHLRARISEGDLLAGHPLPSEPALAAQFGVHRETVRRALSILRAEGLIETRPKSRSRVRAVVEAGALVTEQVPAPPEAAHLLEIPDGFPVERQRQLFFRDGRPSKVSLVYSVGQVA